MIWTSPILKTGLTIAMLLTAGFSGAAYPSNVGIPDREQTQNGDTALLGLCSIVVDEGEVDMPVFEGRGITEVAIHLLVNGQLPVVDLIVVSESGQGDSRIPGHIVQLACTPEEYRMLYPDVREVTGDFGTGLSSSVLVDDELDSLLFGNDADVNMVRALESMIAKGHYPVFAEDHALAASISYICFEPRGDCPDDPPCTDLECLQHECEESCLPPWDPACEGFDCIPCDDWNDCLDPDPDLHLDPEFEACEFVPSKLQENCMISPASTEGISLMANHHDATVTIVFPADGDSQQPEGRCNEAFTTEAVDHVESNFGVSIDIICYDQSPMVSMNNQAWRPSDGGEIKDSADLLDHCENHARNHLSWTHSGLDRVVCWVKQGTYNGIADRPGPFALVAENPSWWRPNMPDVPLTLHEILHTYNAVHYPDDSYRKNLCGVWVSAFPFLGMVYVSFESVMNYCHMYRGSTHMDNINSDRVNQFAGW